MSEILLQTKLFAPQPTAGIVPRTQLLARLHGELTGTPSAQVILVTAPAGYGKSTFTAQWLAALNHPVAWLSLDEYDNEVMRFFAYIIAALQSSVTDFPFKASDETVLFSTNVQKMLQNAAAEGATPTPDELLPLLIQDLLSLPDTIFLVLDDYHLITNRLIHDTIAYLFDHAPRQLHLVLISRTKPPLPIARWRVRGQLIEIHADDLAFTAENADTYLNQHLQLGLTNQEITALVAGTEGWIASLHLIALCLQRQPHRSEFLHTFSAGNRYLFDYLADDVFDRLSAEIQHFLLKTSVLTRFNADLCATLLSTSAGAMSIKTVSEKAEKLADTTIPTPQNVQAARQMLGELERANLFIIPLDEERQWYRYHHLFAEFLRIKLTHRYPGMDRLLLRQAASWYENQGLLTDAIQIALNAQLFDYAAQQIDKMGVALIDEGHVTVLHNWLHQFPDLFIQQYPRLILLQAALYLDMEQYTLAAEWADIAEQQLVSTGSGERNASVPALVNFLAVIRAKLASVRGDLAETLRWSSMVVSADEDSSLQLTGNMAWSIAYAQWQNRQFDAAYHYYQQALVHFQDKAKIIYRILAEYGWLCWEEGHLRQAEALGQRALALNENNDDLNLPRIDLVHILLGQVYLQWYQLDNAQRHCLAAIQTSWTWKHPKRTVQSYLLLTQIRQAEGEFDAAQQAIEQAYADAARITSHAGSKGEGNADVELGAQVTRQQIRLLLARNDMSRAEQVLADLHLANIQGQLLNVRMMVSQGNLDSALVILQSIAVRGMDGGGIAEKLLSLIWRAIIYRGQREYSRATEAIRQALDVAEPEGFIHPFVDIDPSFITTLTSLLHSVMAEHSVSPFLEKVIAAIRQTSVTKASALSLLSTRELEIMRLVRTGMSNAEIANTLFISVNTTKNHLKNIYKKLDVRTRAQAIDKVEATGLLEK